MRLFPTQPRALRRGLGAMASGVLFYVTLVATSWICVLVFRVMNRTTVVGARNTGTQPKLLIVSNHQSLIDSFLVGLIVFFPWIFWRPHLAPFHLADERNFMGHRFLRYVYRVLNVIPVHRNGAGERQDHDAYVKARDALERGGVLHVFIEGTRSRSEHLMPPKPQVGALALNSGATVRPIYITGLHAVHPYRKKPGDVPETWIRRLFGSHTEWLLDIRSGHRLMVVIGDDIPPHEIQQIAGSGDHLEQNVRVADEIMRRIARLQTRLHQDYQHAA